MTGHAVGVAAYKVTASIQEVAWPLVQLVSHCHMLQRDCAVVTGPSTRLDQHHHPLRLFVAVLGTAAASFAEDGLYIAAVAMQLPLANKMV